MKNQIIKLFVLLFIAGFVSACGNEGNGDGHNHEEGEQQESHEGHGEEGMGAFNMAGTDYDGSWDVTGNLGYLANQEENTSVGVSYDLGGVSFFDAEFSAVLFSEFAVSVLTTSLLVKSFFFGFVSAFCGVFSLLIL